MANTEHFEIPKPRETDNIDAEMRRLQAAWDIVDGILNTFLQAINGKAPTNHSHGMEQVTGLATALAGKMASNKTFSLAELTDVVGYTDAPQGYVPVKNADGKIAFLSAAAAIGNHQHQTGDIVGLAALIQSAIDSIVAGAPPDLNTLLEVANALAKRVRVDTTQDITEAEKGNARANIGGGVLSGFRNKVINPSFDIWQRGIGPFTTGYCADRWHLVFGAGASISASRVNFVPVDSVPFVDKYCLNWTRTVAGSASSFLGQKIEGVRTLAGKKVTLTLWARSTAPTAIQPYLQQNFGSGGSPSGIVWNGATSNPQTLVFAGGGVLQRFDFTFDLPKITDKSIGTNNDDTLWLLFEWKSSDPNATITMSRISLVEGDARAEVDPSSPRHIEDENALCDRYYQLHEGTFFAFAASGTASVRRYQLSLRSAMRAVPNVGWNSGDTFVMDERTQYMARWFTDPGSNGPERALGSIRLDAEL